MNNLQRISKINDVEKRSCLLLQYLFRSDQCAISTNNNNNEKVRKLGKIPSKKQHWKYPRKCGKNPIVYSIYNKKNWIASDEVLCK